MANELKIPESPRRSWLPPWRSKTWSEVIAVGAAAAGLVLLPISPVATAICGGVTIIAINIRSVQRSHGRVEHSEKMMRQTSDQLSRASTAITLPREYQCPESGTWSSYRLFSRRLSWGLAAGGNAAVASAVAVVCWSVLDESAEEGTHPGPYIALALLLLKAFIRGAQVHVARERRAWEDGQLAVTQTLRRHNAQQYRVAQQGQVDAARKAAHVSQQVSEWTQQSKAQLWALVGHLKALVADQRRHIDDLERGADRVPSTGSTGVSEGGAGGLRMDSVV